MEHYNKHCPNRAHSDIPCICEKENQENRKHEYKINWKGFLTNGWWPGQKDEVCKNVAIKDTCHKLICVSKITPNKYDHSNNSLIVINVLLRILCRKICTTGLADKLIPNSMEKEIEEVFKDIEEDYDRLQKIHAKKIIEATLKVLERKKPSVP